MTARRKVRLLATGSLVGIAALWASPEAWANGRLPAAHQLAVSPSDPTFFVIEATFGLLVSHDTGATFGWVCESAIGYGTAKVQDPSIGVTPKSVIAGVSQGLAVSTDQGCTWRLAMTAPVIDVVVRRDDPHSALALSSSYVGLTDSGENRFVTQVFASSDDGANWTPVGPPLEPDVQVETIDVAPSDPSRIYVGGARTLLDADGSVSREGIVLASTNGGASYATTVIALIPPLETQGSAYVTAVDPTDPQRVYVRISDNSVDRLLVSDDGAATFRTAYQAQGALPGFAMASDGSKVFLGDSVAGVLLASVPAADSGAAFAFQKRSPALVGCLTLSAGKLYACMGQTQNPFLKQLGVSTDDGLSFTPEFAFGCVSGPLACPSGAVASACTPSLGLLQATIGPCTDGGAAAADASMGEPDSSAVADASDQEDAGVGAEPPGPRPSSCGCEAGEAAGAGGLSAIALVFAIALRRHYASS